MSQRLQAIHAEVVHRRRVRRLAALTAVLLPPNAKVLDVGCGDGQLGALLLHLRPDLVLEGVDVMMRPQAPISVSWFDGRKLPFESKSVDAILLIDVLHHCDDAMALLADCERVARESVIIKDHLADGFLSVPMLRFMDWVGNASHGVALPYNYWTRQQWHDAFALFDWNICNWKQDLAIYPLPADWIFGRNLHFLTQLSPVSATLRASQPGATQT
jgi:SAM-dependent methyltransferase